VHYFIYIPHKRFCCATVIELCLFAIMSYTVLLHCMKDKYCYCCLQCFDTVWKYTRIASCSL